MKKLLLVIIIMLAVVGCSPTMYCHQTKNLSQFEYDKYECMNEAAQVAKNWGATGNPFFIYDRMKVCMTMRGWYGCNQ